MIYIKRIRVKRKDKTIDLSGCKDIVVELKTDYLYVKKRRKLFLKVGEGKIMVLKAKKMRVDGGIFNS